MKNIPTAEEILKKTDSYSYIDDGGDKVFYSGFVELLMIEFAELHVEAALKAAAEPIYPSTKANFELVNSKILNAYPLENIK